MATSRLRLRLVLTSVNTVALIFFTIWLQYITVTRLDELVFYKWFAIARHNVFSLDKKPLGDSLVFVDVSKDLALVNDTFPEYGKQVITDRRALAAFFNAVKIHAGQYRYILCDIAFDYPSNDDSLLNAALSGTRNLIFAQVTEKNKLRGSLFSGEMAAVDYTLNGGAFVKFQVFYGNTVKSLPAVLSEKFSNKIYTRKNGFVLENGYSAVNTFTPELYYRSPDMHAMAEKGGANLFPLGAMLQDPDFFNHYLKNKYIVLGNFYTDLHKTYLGPEPGSLLLINSFLTLRDHSLTLSKGWILFLFIVFFIISYFIFIHPEHNLKELQHNIKPKFLRGFIRTYLSYAGILILVNFISYIFFGLLFSLFYVVTWLTVLEILLEKRKALKAKKNVFTFVKEEII